MPKHANDDIKNDAQVGCKQSLLIINLTFFALSRAANDKFFIKMYR